MADRAPVRDRRRQGRDRVGIALRSLQDVARTPAGQLVQRVAAQPLEAGVDPFDPALRSVTITPLSVRSATNASLPADRALTHQLVAQRVPVLDVQNDAGDPADPPGAIARDLAPAVHPLRTVHVSSRTS